VLPLRELWFCCEVFLLPKPELLDLLSGEVSRSGEAASSGAERACLACRGGSRALGLPAGWGGDDVANGCTGTKRLDSAWIALSDGSSWL